MLEKKYEIRSNEVQEVMNRPPHTFITWGNSIILLILASALLILNRIKLPIKEHLPASFEHFEDTVNKQNATLQRLVFSLNIKRPSTIMVNQKAAIHLAAEKMQNIGNVPAKLDSFWSEKGVTYLLFETSNNRDGQLITTNGKTITPVKGLSLQLDITTREMNVWDYLVYSLFKI